ncbi:MAG TPA: Na+/H+ antiporter NhaA, partial [Acidimicrobiales bacterium]|nr:Na+/H+ antiporter NhaA [Acidimicrobiales bacterium]
DLQHFVNDALMALFFLFVGLEIKRELVTGDLRDRRVAALPVFAAVGGMVVPALIYAAFNYGQPGSAGWGVPLATDIAFALGVLALLGDRVTASLKLFLLSLAIVDDIGAVVVIAIFYAGSLDLVALGLAAVFVVTSLGLRGVRVHWAPLHAALGLACWLAAYNSGVHPTLAGVAFGLITPARPLAPALVVRRWTRDMSDEPSAAELRSLTNAAKETVSPAERLEHLLHPIVGFLIVPLFALMNAGVEIRLDAFDAPGSASVAAGVAFGLVVGKTLGVAGVAWLAVRLRAATLPPDVDWRGIAGIGALAGIGFTVSLFVTGLAFEDRSLEQAAKLAVLASSVVASILGSAILLWRRPRNSQADDPGVAAAHLRP